LVMASRQERDPPRSAKTVKIKEKGFRGVRVKAKREKKRKRGPVSSKANKAQVLVGRDAAGCSQTRRECGREKGG